MPPSIGHRARARFSDRVVVQQMSRLGRGGLTKAEWGGWTRSILKFRSWPSAGWSGRREMSHPVIPARCSPTVSQCEAWLPAGSTCGLCPMKGSPPWTDLCGDVASHHNVAAQRLCRTRRSSLSCHPRQRPPGHADRDGGMAGYLPRLSPTARCMDAGGRPHTMTGEAGRRATRAAAPVSAERERFPYVKRAFPFGLYGRSRPGETVGSTAVPSVLLTRKRSQVQTLSRPPTRPLTSGNAGQFAILGWLGGAMYRMGITYRSYGIARLCICAWSDTIDRCRDLGLWLLK